MSRIINAANRAEAKRDQMREQAERGKGLSGYVQSLKQELRDEFKWMGTVMARWDPAAVPTPPSAANGPVAGEASPALSGPQAGDTAKAHAVTPSWERAMGLVTQQLARCEQQATEEANAQVRLKAQRVCVLAL